MDLHFKKAQQQDVGLIAALADRIWKKHYPEIITMEQIDYMLKAMYSKDSLEKQLKEGQEFTLVYVGETPIGYLSISDKGDGQYFLHKFYVDVNEHRKGVGTQLFHNVLQSNPDLQSIELTVNRANYKSINFYFKLGFHIQRVADFDIGNGYFMNDFVMIFHRR